MLEIVLIMSALAALVGYVWILIKAWTENIPWGAGILFISPLAFVYGILKWEEAKVPTITMGAGVLVHIIARVILAA